MSDRHSFNDTVEAYFKARPGQWVNARELMQVGGTFGWRTRVSNLRTERGLNIQNRQRRVKNAEGKAYTVSEYRYVPADSLPLSVNADGQTCFL